MGVASTVVEGFCKEAGLLQRRLGRGLPPQPYGLKVGGGVSAFGVAG